jgi:hypothetical protein
MSLATLFVIVWRSKGFPDWQFLVRFDGACASYRSKREADAAMAKLPREACVEFKVIQFVPEKS